MGGRRWVNLGIISKGVIKKGAINPQLLLGGSKVVMVMLNKKPGIAAVLCMQLKDIAVIQLHTF